MPDTEEWVDHESRICDPLKANFLAEVKQNARITRRIKAEPKQVETQY